MLQSAVEQSASFPTPTNTSHLPRTTGRSRSTSPLKFFASTDTINPTNTPTSQKAWTVSYLTDLRSNRPVRPSGSRPLPGRNVPSNSLPILEPTLRPSSALALSRPSCSIQQPDLTRTLQPERCSSAMSHHRVHPTALATDAVSPSGGSFSCQPDQRVNVRDFTSSTTGSNVRKAPAGGVYLERGQRWMERQEAHSLREALEDMDSRDEARLHAAAQQEASDLVWQHRNPGAPHAKRGGSRNYKQHLEKGSHARSQSVGYAALGVTKGPEAPSQRSTSDGSTSSSSRSTKAKDSRSSSGNLKDNIERRQEESQAPAYQEDVSSYSPQKKAYTNLTFPIPPLKSLGRRKVSGPKSRMSSGTLFRNPNDKIYEEPDTVSKETEPSASEEDPKPTQLKSKTRNSIARLSSASYGFLPSKTMPQVGYKKPWMTEIQKNPPSQSRNATYVQNESTTSTPKIQVDDSKDGCIGSSQAKVAMEIRSDDIRAATSMRVKDKSQRLPSPTVVSDRPGRPIVSFDKDWCPKANKAERHDWPNTCSMVLDANKPASASLPPKPHLPVSVASAPIIPTISVPDLPAITIDDRSTSSVSEVSLPSFEVSLSPSLPTSCPPLPSISVPEEPPSNCKPLNSKLTGRPSPFRRPLPHHSSTDPVLSSASHWSPLQNRSTAQCAACALPIAGRIVSAASQRFHPRCFSCHHCSELLECVAFYPEPSTSRSARVARIEARVIHPEISDSIDGHTAIDDGDASLRFYCHLDFHELFSPRCRSCKTPIEGEVVLACGGEWHKGHFFCAECGDPFDEKTPFVEKNGYAWCVGCHAGKFNGKCKGCRKVIVEQGIQALGGEWHEGCFRCVVSLLEGYCTREWETDLWYQECGGAFEDGRFFTRGIDERPVCIGCEERRLKA